MSLLIIKNGVKFNHDKYDPVNIILCLAAKDKIICTEIGRAHV